MRAESIYLLNQYLIVYNTAQQSNRGINGINNFEPFELLMLQGYIIAIEVVLVKPLLLHKAHASWERNALVGATPTKFHGQVTLD